jgi:hypothetical protein
LFFCGFCEEISIVFVAAPDFPTVAHEPAVAPLVTFLIGAELADFSEFAVYAMLEGGVGRVARAFGTVGITMLRVDTTISSERKTFGIEIMPNPSFA